MRPIRRRMQMVFQDPYGSLNPRMKVRDIVGEPLEVHGMAADRADLRRARRRADRAWSACCPTWPTAIRTNSPAASASASASPARWRSTRALIICDEPVSALDVSIQAQVVNLFMELQERLGLTYIFIAHDLAVVRHISRPHRRDVSRPHRRDRRRATSSTPSPLHPYTRGAAGRDPGRRSRGRGEPPAADHHRRGAERAAPAARLPLPHALSRRRWTCARASIRRCATWAVAAPSPVIYTTLHDAAPRFLSWRWRWSRLCPPRRASRPISPCRTSTSCRSCRRPSSIPGAAGAGAARRSVRRRPSASSRPSATSTNRPTPCSAPCWASRCEPPPCRPRRACSRGMRDTGMRCSARPRRRSSASGPT